MARTLSLQVTALPWTKPQAKRKLKRARKTHADALAPMRLFRLNVLTLGLYFVYWQYRSWERVRIAHRLRIRSGWRALLWPFYCRSLYEQALDVARGDGYRKTFVSGQLQALSLIAPPLLWLSTRVVAFEAFLALTVVGLSLLGYVMATVQDALNAHLKRHPHMRKTHVNQALVLLLFTAGMAVLVAEIFARWTIK